MSGIRFTVIGTPRATQTGSVIHVRRKDGTSYRFPVRRNTDWRNLVILQASQYAPETPLEGPLLVTALFYRERPKSTPKKQELPTQRPDVENYEKGFWDALEEAGIYKDDAQTVFKITGKLFGSPPRVEVSIKVTTLAEVLAKAKELS